MPHKQLLANRLTMQSRMPNQMSTRTKWMLIWGAVVLAAAVLLLAMQALWQWFPFWLGMPLLALFAVVVYSAIFFFRTYRQEYAATRDLLRQQNADKPVMVFLFFLPFGLSLFIGGILGGLILAGPAGITKAQDWLASPIVQFCVFLTLLFFAMGDHRAQKALSSDVEKQRPFSNNLHYLDIPFVVTASVLLAFDMGLYSASQIGLFATPAEWEAFLKTWAAFLGGATAFQLLAQNTAFVWVTNTPGVP